MSNAVNYGDVISQLEAAGLDTSQFAVGTSRPVRCMVDGEKGRKGWYWLHELPFDSGDIVIVGSYGIWHGNDNGACKIEVPKSAHATRDDNALVRRRIAENKRRLALEQKRAQERAAARAMQKWRALSQDGHSGYLERKHVGAFGIRFTADGAIAVPMTDADGTIHGLQFILDKGNEAHKERIRKMEGDKRFWPTGLAMQGRFHMIGAPLPGDVILIAEGYATAASLHMASGLPVAVVFTANNIVPAIRSMEKAYRGARFLVCADDDYLCRCRHCRKQTPVTDDKRTIIPCQHCGEAHGKVNTGITEAMKAAVAIDPAEWIRPEFTNRGSRKLTDFNDLHVDESLQAVKVQVQAAIASKFPQAGQAKPAPERRNGGVGASAPRYMSEDDAVDRYSLIYGVKDTMFDHRMFKLVPKSCVMDVIPDHAWRSMRRRSDFQVFDISQVGFDPGGTDGNIECNMWGGWPTMPSSEGSCERLLELLEYLCSAEPNAREVYQWVLRWLAYPIRNPGAKMKTALVIHGGQGVGKNLFFESVMAIYSDEYGRIIGQAEIEDKFNEWASKRLFLIANEVVARQELFHQKNKLKALITDDWIHINPKNVAAHDERNHMNLVFLSNEAQPVVLDPDDRRFMAIWTPPKREHAFYQLVLEEIGAGGIGALHRHLLENVDMGEFHPGTPPIDTRARRALIEISKETPDRFADVWMAGEISDVPCQACALADLYTAYVRWCKGEGERYSYSKVKFSSHIGRRQDIDVERKPILLGNGKTGTVTMALPATDSGPEDGEHWMKWTAERIRTFKKAMEKTEDGF